MYDSNVIVNFDQICGTGKLQRDSREIYMLGYTFYFFLLRNELSTKNYNNIFYKIYAITFNFCRESNPIHIPCDDVKRVYVKNLYYLYICRIEVMVYLLL